MWIQYNIETGAVEGSLSNQVDAKQLPANRAQIEYNGEYDVAFLKINLQTKEVEYHEPLGDEG